jgi:MoxR-like ATPase
MMKVLVDYPNEREEFVIVERMTGTLSPVQCVLSTEQLLDLQKEADQVYVDPALIEYAIRIVGATRDPKEYGIQDTAHYITYGASPRASINLILTARALAFIRVRDYVLVQDIADMVHDVLRHRMVLSFEAMSDNVTSDMILRRVLERVPAPTQPLKEHVLVNA